MPIKYLAKLKNPDPGICSKAGGVLKQRSKPIAVNNAAHMVCVVLSGSVPISQILFRQESREESPLNYFYCMIAGR